MNSYVGVLREQGAPKSRAAKQGHLLIGNAADVGRLRFVFRGGVRNPASFKFRATVKVPGRPW